MSMEPYSLGCAPGKEESAQMGEPGYARQAIKECHALIDMIRRHLGKEPLGSTLEVRPARHEKGTYYEVVLWHRDDHQAAVDYAIKVEEKLPLTWDEQAKEFLQNFQT